MDSLAPKRDIGLMTEVAFGTFGSLALGVFNGDGQNRPSNRDSSVLVVARATVRPISQLTLAIDFARPAISATLHTVATTGGVNVDMSGGRVRLIADYVSRRWGSPGTRVGVLVTQLQVRF